MLCCRRFSRATRSDAARNSRAAATCLLLGNFTSHNVNPRVWTMTPPWAVRDDQGQDETDCFASLRAARVGAESRSPFAAPSPRALWLEGLEARCHTLKNARIYQPIRRSHTGTIVPPTTGEVIHTWSRRGDVVGNFVCFSIDPNSFKHEPHPFLVGTRRVCTSDPEPMSTTTLLLNIRCLLPVAPDVAFQLFCQ